MGYKFVLVHGSWQDARSWDAVTPLLERMGHQVWAPTIAGHTPSAPKNVSHADCVASVVDAIRQHGVSDFVLVGHSFGGTIIQRVAEEMPERIRRLVFWNGCVLNDGDNLDINTPPHYRALLDQIAQPDGGAMLPFPIWREAFLNDADFALAKRVYDERLSPSPRRSHTDPVPLKTFFSLQIPKSYLNCTEDIALPPGPEWGWHPRMSSRLGLYRLVQMPGSHQVNFTNPELLALKIVEAGRD
jgi:pimeloyl-ACP methyl ester carboxylesterase